MCEDEVFECADCILRRSLCPRHRAMTDAAVEAALAGKDAERARIAAVWANDGRTHESNPNFECEMDAALTPPPAEEGLGNEKAHMVLSGLLGIQDLSMRSEVMTTSPARRERVLEVMEQWISYCGRRQMQNTKCPKGGQPEWTRGQ